jgi:hypothetical protein
MYRTILASLAALSLVFAAGCSQQVDDPAPTSESANGLSMQEVENGVVGTYFTERFEISFSSKMVEPSVADIVLRFNEMTITALVDLEKGLMEYDGYASDNGEDTQLTDADREAILGLTKALDGLGEQVDQPVSLLRRFTSVWSEFPSSLELQRQAFAEKDRSYYSLCGYCDGYYIEATHDCWDYDRGDDQSTYNAYLSMHPAGPCSGETYFWTGSAWSCYTPDHSSTVEYAYGACFGRCGGGCGSDSQMTWDCLDHDSCVRFGHSMASFWCDDEFASTIDDWASAPNCGSTCGL